jgi:hypothetical protein
MRSNCAPDIVVTNSCPSILMFPGTRKPSVSCILVHLCPLNFEVSAGKMEMVNGSSPSGWSILGRRI